MASVYQKVNAICVHTLQNYEDYSQIQIYDKTGENFNIYRAYPDSNKGYQYMRDMFLEVSRSDIPKLCQFVKKLIRRNENDKIVMEISKTSEERLVIKSHHTFKTLILGYQKHKTTPLRSNPMKFNENSVLNKRGCSSSELIQWGEFEKFTTFNFRKTDRLDIIYCNLNNYVDEIRRMEQENL